MNALRLASRVIAALPSDNLTPETTSGREGYIHPYEIEGTPRRATFRVLAARLRRRQAGRARAARRRTAEEIVGAEPRARVEIAVEDQYPNMRRYLEPYPEIVATAERAIRAEGIEPLHSPLAAAPTARCSAPAGFPTPNIFAGGHEFHSVREWVSLQDMAAAAATIVRLAGEWAPGPPR